VQDPKTANVSTMPESCIERTTPNLIGTLSDLAAFAVKQGSEAST
jgi:hypothetical protein